jgi:plasmid stabilization system protein ParE
VTFRFLDVAETELHQAVQWYESQAPGLGDAFLIEVLSAAERISLYPDAWHSLDKGLRRCRLNRFPYGLIYAIEDDDILVLAVAHLHREPGYWRNRVR